MTAYTQEIRQAALLEGLLLDQPGLEVSPLFRPTALKGEHNVFYTDYTSAAKSRKKHKTYKHEEIMEIDFIWTPGKKLAKCIPNGRKFHWAIASHVFEHVPNPIGWLLEILEVLEVGGVVSLALPNKNACYDRFRSETQVAELIDVWVRRQSIPSPRQIYDFLSRTVDDSGEDGQRAYETAQSFEEATRIHSDKKALKYVFHSWATGIYLDVHCSVFTAESFYNVFSKIIELGIINAKLPEPEMIVHNEFFVKLIKQGDPKVSLPNKSLTKKNVAIVKSFVRELIS